MRSKTAYFFSIIVNILNPSSLLISLSCYNLRPLAAIERYCVVLSQRVQKKERKKRANPKTVSIQNTTFYYKMIDNNGLIERSQVKH